MSELPSSNAPTGRAHHHGGHHHGHSHAVRIPKLPRSGLPRALAIGIVLNLGFVAVETGFGLYAHSLSLIADASHNFGDVISLALASGALILAQRNPSPEYTYGLRGTTILAALANAMILLVVTGGIVWASVDRLRALGPVNADAVIGVAAFGVLINGLTAWFLMADRHSDVNARAAFLHMAGDAAVSLGVIAAAFAMRYTGWLWLDPTVSIAIALIILIGTWGLLKESLRLAMHAVPVGVDAQAVRHYLAAQPGVAQAHDLHIWAMSTTETAMTAHLVMPAGAPGDEFLQRVADELDERFNVGHVTLQVETAKDGCVCRLTGRCVA